MTLDYGKYFDQDYYENGHLKGTAYNNYRAAVLQSREYAEIAERLTAFFAPRRVLEIGCGMGQIGWHFERLGVEYVGSEVSDYCVANKFCAGVFKHDEVKLPFPDGHFDLVFGCHSIEHFPDEIFLSSLREQMRVTRGYYGHYLPMLGPAPLLSREGLRKDPTHFQLHTPPEWVRHVLSADGQMTYLDTLLPMSNPQLYYSQLWFSRGGVRPTPQTHVAEYHRVAGELFRQLADWKDARARQAEEMKATRLLQKTEQSHLRFALSARQGVVGPSEQDEWQDENIRFVHRQDHVRQLLLATRGIDRDCRFRIVLLDGDDYEADYWISTSTDVFLTISFADFTVRKGEARPRFDEIRVGGASLPCRFEFILVMEEATPPEFPVVAQPQAAPEPQVSRTGILPSSAKALLRPPYRLSRSLLRRLRRLTQG